MSYCTCFKNASRSAIACGSIVFSNPSGMSDLPLLAIWTAGLVAAREDNRAPRWWLILVMPLWANLHGSFAFGLALAGALAVEAVVEDRKQLLGWGLFVVAAIASALLTPFGVAGLLFPFKLSAMQGLAHIGEWQPSDFTTLSPFAIALLASLFLLFLGYSGLAISLWPNAAR